MNDIESFLQSKGYTESSKKTARKALALYFKHNCSDLASYREALREHGKTEKTIKIYSPFVKAYLEWLKDKASAPQSQKMERIEEPALEKPSEQESTEPVSPIKEEFLKSIKEGPSDAPIKQDSASMQHHEKSVLVDPSGKEYEITCENFVPSPSIWKFETYDKIRCIDSKRKKILELEQPICLKCWLEKLAKLEEMEPKLDVSLSEEALKALQTENLLEKISAHMKKDVKHDDPLTELIPLVALSAFYKEPANQLLEGVSGVGKSYITAHGVKYFPEKNVWLLGGLSPTALVHGYGVWDKQQKAYIVNLGNKVLVFLEAPHEDTFYKLRPILSHDKPEITFKFTHTKTLKTQTVILKGFPATIWCTSGMRYMADFATRCLRYTPNASMEKIKEGVSLLFKEHAFPEQPDEELKILKEQVEALIYLIITNDVDVLVPYAEEIATFHPCSLVRDMRDAKRFLTLIELYCLFNACRRLVLEIDGKKSLLATQEDYERAITLYSSGLIEMTRTEMVAEVSDFFNNVFLPVASEEGNTTYATLMEKYHEVYKRFIGRNTMRDRFIEPLKQRGWVLDDTNPVDKRQRVLFAQRKEPYHIDGDVAQFLKAQFTEFFNEDKLEKWFEKLGASHRFKLYENLLQQAPLYDGSEGFNPEAFVMCKPKISASIFNSREPISQPLEHNAKAKTEMEEPVEPPTPEPFTPEDVLSVTRLDASEKGKCVVCGVETDLEFQITKHNGEWGLACMDCGLKTQEALATGETGLKKW